MDAQRHQPQGNQTEARSTVIRLFQVFLSLQLVDAFTTVLALRFGGQELNPVLRGFMHLGPITGLIAGKMMVLAIGAFVVWYERPRVLALANTFYAGLAGWNVMILLGLKA